MLKQSQGWISNNDNYDKGVNMNYYINVNIWFRTLSPYGLYTDNHGHIIFISNDGPIGNRTNDRNDGGVPCYFIFTVRIMLFIYFEPRLDF